MEKKPNDFLTGCVVIAAFIALSAYAGGWRALLYIGAVLIAGVLLVCLKKRKAGGDSGAPDERS